MKVFVTGGCGYIGSHVCKQLVESGHEVTVFDNLSSGFREALVSGERLIQGDLSSLADIGNALREDSYEAILHFAASISVAESVVNPLKYYRNNTCNTVNLLQAAADAGIEKLIFSSTAAVYGANSGGFASEETALAPINPYGWSKMMSERIISDTMKSGARVVLRYFNVAGADPSGLIGQRKPDAEHLLKVCLQAASGKRGSVSIFGTDYDTPDGTGVRDYIHVFDLASAHIRALEYLEKGGASNVFNVGYGTGQSVRDMISTVKEVTCSDFRVVESPRREGDPGMMVAKADKIKDILGWEPCRGDLKTIVEDSWRWEQLIDTSIVVDKSKLDG